MDNLNGENLEVGNDCSAIGMKIYKSATLKDKDNAMLFARMLTKDTNLDVEKLHKDYAILDKIGFSDFVIKVMEHWVAKNAGQATVAVLLDVLEEHCQDVESGEVIRLFYKLPCKDCKRPELKFSDLSDAFKERVRETSAQEMLYTEDEIEWQKPTILIPLMMGKRPLSTNAATNSNGQPKQESMHLR